MKKFITVGEEAYIINRFAENRERERLLALLEPFFIKALLHEVTVNDCHQLQLAIKGKTE